MTAPPREPDHDGQTECEQLDLPEDVERLAEIGDLVLAGEPIEHFDLGNYERIFVLGYVRSGGEPTDAA